ncbi:572_t:CDS:2, partial [Dentiscutata erythropus]
KLVDNLVTVFEMDNPLFYQLFQKYTLTELHQEGLNRLIACYPDGRTIRLVRTKLKDYDKKSSRNEVEKEIIQPVAENSNEEPPTTEPQPKRRKTTGTKHRTTNDEITILSILKIHKNNLLNKAIASVREKLSEVWTIKK